MKLYPIGQFSTITKITVKALRLYHDKEIMVPSSIDEQTGYRYYHENQLERAETIRALKSLDFSLQEIAEIMSHFNEDSEMVPFLQKKSKMLEEKIASFNSIKTQLDLMINKEQKQACNTYPQTIETRQIPDQQIAGIRFQGIYQEVGKYFKRLSMAVGRQASGIIGSLYYDGEYKEDNADIEAFIPVKRQVNKQEIISRNLPGGKAHCLIHIGPYDTLHRSYKLIIDYLQENDITTVLPIREIYIKGPGMIFKGNPKKYVTELQFLET